MSPSIDFEGVKDLEPVDKGTYPAVFSEFELKEGDKGPYYVCRYKITDGEFADRTLFNNLSCSEKSLWAFKRTCIALGANPTDFEGEVDTDEMLEALVGNECRLQVGLKKYEGRDVNNVDAVLAVSGSFARS